MRYALKLDQPLPYYAEEHRPQHFLSFANMEAGAEEDGVDIDDVLA